MGMNFSTVQVQNRNKLSQQQLAQQISKLMEVWGCKPTTEETADTTLYIALSKNAEWAT